MTERRTAGRRGRGGQPVLVTSARLSGSDDQRRRQQRYFASQGLRVLCILLQALPLPGWLRVVLILLAVGLPWMGVVQANAGPAQTLKQQGAPLPGAVPGQDLSRPALSTARVIDAEPVHRVVDAEPVHRVVPDPA